MHSNKVVMIINQVIAIFFLALLVGCAPDSTPVPTLVSIFPIPVTTVDMLFISNGAGEPRSPSYWIVWNTCTPDNQSAVADVNGGREAGWVILDDVLQDPGLTLGDLPVESCPQAVNLLTLHDLDSVDRSSDAAYQLAQGLLGAQLNLFVGSETCSGVEQAVLAAHLLLSSLSFTGQGAYLEASSKGKEYQTAIILAGQLETYNLGELCR